MHGLAIPVFCEKLKVLVLSVGEIRASVLHNLMWEDGTWMAQATSCVDTPRCPEAIQFQYWELGVVSHPSPLTIWHRAASHPYVLPSGGYFNRVRKVGGSEESFSAVSCGLPASC